MSEHKKDAPQSKRRKLLLTGASIVTATIVMVSWSAFTSRGLEDESVEDASSTDQSEPTDTESHAEPASLEDDDPYVDERPELSEEEIEMLHQEVLNLAYQGQWLDIVDLVEPYEMDYNLEATELSQQVQYFYLDANRLARLTAMGDTPDAVDATVEDLPRLHTEELFVLGLYYLPRNVLLELSVDHLALAPTQRGHVEITARTDLPFTLDDITPNEEVNEHEVIQRYLGMIRENDYEEGFVRLDITNGPIEEYVYVVHQADGNFGLVGFYSDDDSPANTTQTVDHHLGFRQDVQKGLEALYNEAQEEYEQSVEEAEVKDDSGDDDDHEHDHDHSETNLPDDPNANTTGDIEWIIDDDEHDHDH